MIQGSELATILQVKPQLINNLRTRYSLVDGEDTITQANKRRYYTPSGLRKILKNRGYSFDKKVVSVCNVKGGVGKSSIASSLALKASSLGFKTLLIDLDKQGNATDQIWPEGRESDFPCLYDVIKKSATFNSSIVRINDFLSLFPSNLKNQLLEIEITSKNINKGQFFKKFLDELDFDLVIYDTEPNLSQVNLMALASTDINISPVKMDKSSIDGLELVLDFIEDQKEEWPGMHVETKVLINAFDKRMTTEAIKKMSEIQSLGVDTFQTMVRTDQSFVKAQELGEVKKGTKAYEDITNLSVELLELDKIKNLQ